MTPILSWALALGLVLPAGPAAPAAPHAGSAREDDPVWDRKAERAAAKLAERWWKARPKTYFEAWEPADRTALEEEARVLGALPEGVLDEVVAALWKPAAKHGPQVKERRGKLTLETPYGEAWAYLAGSGKEQALVLGLHGGGEDSGSAGEARGAWSAKGAIGIYPQGIRLVHDTWNTVHGERLALSLIEIAKAQLRVDPDRVYTVGFSMGGTGSWFLAGRHPDLFAGAIPAAGVFMAQPKSQLARKEDVVRVQHGLLPNVRNLAMYWYIGLEDENCMPGTYLFAWDRLQALRAADPDGYGRLRFEMYEGLPHAFPPGEPGAGLEWILGETRDTFPTTLVWEIATDPFPLPGADDLVARVPKRHFYWLRCDDPVDNQHVRATREGNAITIAVRNRPQGARGLTLYLNDRMIDPGEDVVVHEGEVELYRGRPQPDLWTVLETLDARVDHAMVFDRRIEL